MSPHPSRFPRAFHRLATVAVFSLLAFAALAQASGEPAASPTAAPPQPSPKPTMTPAPARPTPRASPPGQPTPPPKPKPPKPDQWGEARRVFEQLPPDQQKKFLDNLDQWKAMPPEEQELFRDRELFRREKIAQEIQDAINRSGLRLDEDQREVYALRYAQERRKIEEALRKELEKKRQMMLTEMLGRLKIEFAPTPPPTPSPY